MAGAGIVGVVVNIEKTVQAITQAVDEASRKSNVQVQVVHVALPVSISKVFSTATPLRGMMRNRK